MRGSAAAGFRGWKGSGRNIIEAAQRKEIAPENDRTGDRLEGTDGKRA